MSEPPPKRKVEWKILLAQTSELINVTDQESQLISEALSSEEGFFEIKQDGSQVKLQIYVDLVVKGINDPSKVYGYLIWIPAYKK